MPIWPLAGLSVALVDLSAAALAKAVATIDRYS
jgi:hypothetical protein